MKIPSSNDRGFDEISEAWVCKGVPADVPDSGRDTSMPKNGINDFQNIISTLVKVDQDINDDELHT